VAVETRPGSTFAGYLIVGTVGRGGMGVVYRARELALDRPVALKLIAPELARDPAFRERFLEESRIAASLDHASILPVYAAGEADGELYIATRYVEGTDLRRLLAREQALEPERALKLVGQIAEALDAAHRRGLVHRDVKPGNVLVDTSDHCYLCDFGLTKELADEGTSASDPLAGSLDYLAPEQIRRGDVDGRTDQYALACVFYECLAGSSPFRRETQVETLWAHLHETPPPLADLPALDPVLARALAADPEKRYPSCSAFVEDARSAIGLGLSATVVRKRRFRLGRRPVIAAALLLAAVAVAVTLAALTLGEGTGVAVPPNSVAAIDPASGEVVAAIPLEGWPPAGLMAASDEWVWAVVETSEGKAISKIDVKSRRVVDTFSVRGQPRNLLAAAGSLWVSTWQGHVFRIDPSGNGVRGDWTLPNAGRGEGRYSTFRGIGALAYGAGSIWAVSFRAISRIDLETSKIVPGKSSRWGPLAFGFGALWVLPQRVDYVYRLAPQTLEPQARMFYPNDLQALREVEIGEESVWLAAARLRVYEIDPSRLVLVRAYYPGRISDLAVGAGSAWAATDDDVIVRIDPTTGDTERIDVGGTPYGIAVGGDLVWVGVGQPDR
jgi:serine/threonine-protein kinase